MRHSIQTKKQVRVINKFSSSRSLMFFKIDVLKKETPTYVFSCEIYDG